MEFITPNILGGYAYNGLPVIENLIKLQVTSFTGNLLAHLSYNIDLIFFKAVVTHDLEFIDVAVGFPGSIADGRVFQLSPLNAAFNARLARSNYHILADTAYPLRSHLMVPFRNNGELEDHEVAFNCSLKSDR